MNLFATAFTLAFLGFVAGLWANTYEWNYAGKMVSRLTQPIADTLVLHPVFFFVLDSILSWATIVLPVIIWRLRYRLASERLLMTLSVQSLGFIMALVTLHDTTYAWSTPLFIVLYTLRLLALISSRMQISRTTDNSEPVASQYVGASIINLNILWVYVVLLLSVVVLVVDYSAADYSDEIHVTMIRWSSVASLVAFVGFSYIALVSDIHALWLVVGIDALIVAYNNWPGALSALIIGVFFVANTCVILYTFVGVVLSVVRTQSIVPPNYLLEGFDIVALLFSDNPKLDAEQGVRNELPLSDIPQEDAPRITIRRGKISTSEFLTAVGRAVKEK